MKAVYIAGFGSTEGIEIRDVPEPARPETSQVLVKVKAVGLNRADLLQVAGKYPPPPGYSPNIPGLEFAGEVVDVGPDVAAWNPGDRVFGIVAGESQAEYLLTDETLLARVPENLSFTAASAVPEAFITALDAVVTLGNLGEGDDLLIHAVGSGVGLAALQIAKARGATVTGTSRTAEKLDRCKAFGLDHAIVTTGNDFAEQVKKRTGGKGADVILDLVGAAYFENNLASLALRGRLVLVGLTSGNTSEFNLGALMYKRAQIIGTVLRARTTEEKALATRLFADEVLPLITSGIVTANVDSVFAVEDVIQAYNYLRSNDGFGKVVIEF